MPLFPSRRYAFMPAPPQEQTVRDKFTAPQRRRGLFGGPARGIVRREDGDPGTLLNYLVFGQGGVEDMRESRMNRDLFGMRSQAFKQEQADAQRQRGEIDAAIGTLDPSLQPWARLAPEVAARAALAGPEQPDYQIDAQGRPYTIQNGRVMYGEGQVAVPPRGVAGERAPPAGYRFTPDGNLEAIPGGPADLRAGEAAQRNRRFYETAIRNRQNVLQSIQNARQLARRAGTTGVFGQVLGGLGGTDAHDLQSEVDTIIGNIGFEALQEMRQNSQTGGALGQVAVRELELLQTTIANLRISQSGEQFQRNLQRVEDQYRRTLAAYQSALGELQGGGQEQAPTNDGSGPEQPRSRTWTPDGGLSP